MSSFTQRLLCLCAHSPCRNYLAFRSEHSRGETAITDRLACWREEQRVGGERERARERDNEITYGWWWYVDIQNGGMGNPRKGLNWMRSRTCDVIKDKKRV